MTTFSTGNTYFLRFEYLAEYSFSAGVQDEVRPLLLEAVLCPGVTIVVTGVNLPDGFSVERGTGAVVFNAKPGRYTIEVEAVASNGLTAKTSFLLNLI